MTAFDHINRGHGSTPLFFATAIAESIKFTNTLNTLINISDIKLPKLKGEEAIISGCDQVS